MRDVGLIKNGIVAIKDGRIIYVGKGDLPKGIKKRW